MTTRPIAVVASDVAPRVKKSVYPPMFAARMEGREKRVLGELFGLTHFGVNLTTLAPGAQSALLHAHSSQQEFLYVLEGTPTLVTGSGEHVLSAGMCVGFTPETGAHQVVNRSAAKVVYLEVGDRSAGDTVEYPNDDLAATFVDGAWRFTHKDGTPW
ncbi:MAG: cupin domain-containing protein [Archangium sp.]|nr:cupin domain-containing protein [Archangium sp.]